MSTCTRAALAALMSALALEAGTAEAVLPQRTFVAVSGNDGNPCAVAAPCRSFAAALALTAPGGEVIVLESGAYGRVTVTQPVTIEAPAGVYAGISVFATFNGIDVNAPGATVTLRGLSINGQGGNVGINVGAVGFLRIDRCRVSGMGQQGVVVTSGSVVITNGYISDNGHDGVWANGVVDVVVRDTVSTRNLSGAAFFAGARATLRDSTFTSNQFFGVYARGGPTATPTTVRADRIDVSFNTGTGIVMSGIASSFGTMALTRSTVAANGNNALYAEDAGGPVDVFIDDSTFSGHPAPYPAVAAGGGAKLVISRSSAVDNGSVAFYQFGSAAFESRGDNTLRNNNGGGAQTIGSITTFGGT